jgi:hypothetical protein
MRLVGASVIFSAKRHPLSDQVQRMPFSGSGSKGIHVFRAPQQGEIAARRLALSAALATVR